MKSIALVTLTLLTSCLTAPGDFCDLYQRVSLTDREAVELLVQRERQAAENIAVNERTAGECGA